MDDRESQERARTFVRGVRRLSGRLSGQSLSELRESSVDAATRSTISGLARGCKGLLDGHEAKWALDALIGLDPEIASAADIPKIGAPVEKVTKETLLDWLDLVSDALDDLFRPPEERLEFVGRATKVVARIPKRPSDTGALGKDDKHRAEAAQRHDQ